MTTATIIPERLDEKPNEAHVETCGAGYSEYAMCDSPEACADLRNAPVVEPKAACEGCPDPGLPCAGCPAVEPEPCRYTQPDGTRCGRPGEPKHGMCGPHYWARDDERHAPVVEPSPVCGARVDYHGGTCGRPVGHDEPCAPFVERERMPCGHTRAAIVSSGEGTSYCGECVEACSPDDYETGPELDAATSAGSMTNLDDASVHYQQGWDAGHTAGIDTGRADERDGYSGEHSPSAVEAGNDGERATHATGSDAVGLSPSSRCACGATITGTRCDASGMTAAVCQKVPLLDSTDSLTNDGSMRDSGCKIIDLFAGPGGWDEALASLGRHDVLGVEYDEPCTRTRLAAGHATLHANVAELDPLDFAGIEGLIASPPCQAWSMAGSRGAVQDQPLVYHVMEQLVQGRDVRAAARADAVDERSLLVAEPLRWALALRPRWIACEQVEPVADLWAWMADQLRSIGYNAWSGVLSAERYGVPQTRKRAFLIASLDGPVYPPAPTHQAYRAGEPAAYQDTFEGELQPWISMAGALGWGFDEQPAPTVSGGGGRDNGVGVFAGQQQRNRLRAIVQANNTTGSDGERRPYERSVDDPSPTVIPNIDRWKVMPEPTHYNSRDQRSGRTGKPNRMRAIDEPAPTIAGESRNDSWVFDRPATTVAGDPRVSKPGHRDREGGERQFDGAVRVTLEEALMLQSFRPDYPVQGNQGQRFQQVGNAVPPLLASAVLTSVLTPKEARRAG